jgi:hypothetical protein
MDPSAPNAQGLARAAFTFRDSLTRGDLDLLFEHRELLPAEFRAVLVAERARVLVARSGSQDDFYVVGQGLSTILVACLGGLSGVVLRATQGAGARGEILSHINHSTEPNREAS